AGGAQGPLGRFFQALPVFEERKGAVELTFGVTLQIAQRSGRDLLGDPVSVFTRDRAFGRTGSDLPRLQGAVLGDVPAEDIGNRLLQALRHPEELLLGGEARAPVVQ